MRLPSADMNRRGLTGRVGGLVHRQVRQDLSWELRALRVRIRTALRPPRPPGEGPYRINIGAGTHRTPGWLTIDLDPTADVVADVRWRIPLQDGTCEAAFCEHILEHLRYRDEAPGLLSEVLRVLVPGAPLRISVPDASRYLRAYSEGDLGDLAKVHPPADTPMTVVNWTFHGYGHRFGYDEATLRGLLERVGFADVTRSEFGHSAFPGLAIDRPEREVESLYLEAVKPQGERIGRR